MMISVEVASVMPCIASSIMKELIHRYGAWIVFALYF